MAMSAENKKQDFRPSASFPPTVWGYSFAKFSYLGSEFENYTKEVELLKENVKNMLLQSTKEVIEYIKFINLLCRLGVSYHFENEIDEQLNHIFTILSSLFYHNNYDLQTVALLFQVLRQYGYKVPCNVFNKFKDYNGEFKKEIINDVKGLITLYEATFLSVHGEDILDEALAFTRQHLETLVTKLCPRLAKYIRNALFQPFYHGVERLEARKYISFYEEDDSRNETLLKFAKLDYNRLQLLYRQEVALVSRWCKELNFAEKLPFTRDRVAELFFFVHGSNCEPQYSLARISGTKNLALISALDDIFDAYGTIDELTRFTAAFHRWSIDAIDEHELPEYMKFIYKTILDFYDESENHDNEGRCNRTSFAKELLKELVGHYFQEAKWFKEGVVPPFDEYMYNGIRTCGFDKLLAGTFIPMDDVMGVEDFECFKTSPNIGQLVNYLGRLINDMASHEEEQRRGHCSSAVECYMKEYGVSQAKAIKEIEKLCENKWKDINEEGMKPTVDSRFVFKNYLNLARTADVVYKLGDSYTRSSILKDEVSVLLLDQIPM